MNSHRPIRVMLVDDEQAFVQTLAKRLATRQIECSVAFGGAEALGKFGLDAPDVMVLDLKMPEVDGLEVLRKVKADRPETEVIILTAHGSDAEMRLVSQMGAFSCLHKPVDIDELTEQLERAYRRMWYRWCRSQGQGRPKTGADHPAGMPGMQTVPSEGQ